MSDQPYLVVSTDSHAGPSLEHQLREYCPARHLEAFDEYAAEVRARYSQPGPKGIAVAMHDEQRIEFVKTCKGLQDPHARLRDMDADGIAADVVFAGGQNDEALPFVGGGFDAGHADLPAELRIEGGRIWNRWTADFCSVAPERLIGVMQIPIWDLDTAMADIRAGVEAGLRIVNLPAPRADFPTYNDPVYEPFWSLCEELRVAFVTHSAGGERPLGITGPGALALLYNAEGHWFSRRALWQLIFAGVFERHPGLKMIFTEQRVAWVGETLAELDSLYFADDPHPRPPRTPSEYWASNCYIAGSFLAPFEVAMRDVVGKRNLMWGSDYPHVEGTWPRTRLSLRHTFAGVPEEDVRQIIGLNAIDVYGLDADVLGELAVRIGPLPSELHPPVPEDELPEHRGCAFRVRGGFS